VVAVSLNTLCYEGICRIYRNAVVRQVRKVMKETYPGDWITPVRKLFHEDDWNKAREQAKEIRATGQLQAPLVDELDIMGVNHFYNVFDSHFELIFPPRDADNADIRKKRKGFILSCAKQIKDMRDAVLGHPGERSISGPDAIGLLNSAKKILEYIDTDAANEIDALIRKAMVPDPDLDDDVDERPIGHLREVGTLPSRESIAPRFVGRRRELEQLHRWFNDQHSHVWILAGDGGKGKTAIAYEFATQIAKAAPREYYAIIWLSAKQRRYEPESGVSRVAPDFDNLESALRAVLLAYWEAAPSDADVASQKAEALQYLKMLPALIVVDDVDSLEGEGVHAIPFFLLEASRTPSKVLFTSRRPVGFGLESMTTQVSGFLPGSDDASQFVLTRAELFGLDRRELTQARINEIVTTCDGSPLFIEDLLRLCACGEPVSRAVSIWKGRGGHDARKYALGRELDMLPETARAALVACALYSDPCSIADIRATTGLSDSQARDAIRRLQQLFLVPKPELIQGRPRFRLNSNTRRLVLEVEGESDRARRVRHAMKQLSGGLESTHARKAVSQYILQAVSLVRVGDHAAAETTLRTALENLGEEADLVGALGWVYKNWSPQPRCTDARDRFRRAAELGTKRLDTFTHWWDMECWRHEWVQAAHAAKRGLANLGNLPTLHYMAGYAHSRLARELLQSFQYHRTVDECLTAEKHLVQALVNPEDVRSGEYSGRAKVLRSLVLTYELLIRAKSNSDDPTDASEARRYLKLLGDTLHRWLKEHPDDRKARTESARLELYFPSLRGQPD